MKKFNEIREENEKLVAKNDSKEANCSSKGSYNCKSGQAIPINKEFLEDVEKYLGMHEGITVEKDGTISIQNYKISIVKNDITNE